MMAILPLISAAGVMLKGGDIGGGGGTITIVPDRTTLQVAPDSVRFSVDLSASTFDTAGPTGSEVYDARMHDKIYLWDFDDPGTWSAPVNVLAAWKNRSVAKGPYVAHMYTAAGTYNPSVLVIEPSSGKTATATYEVVVSDPDTVFADADTVYINPTVDETFTGVPGSSTKLNLDDVTIADLSAYLDSRTTNSNPKRLRFKRGAEYDSVYIEFSQFTWPNLLIDDYGDSEDPRPILNMPTTETLNYNFLPGGTVLAPYDLRVSNLNCEGTWNPVVDSYPAGSSDTHGFMRVTSVADLMVHNCRIAGAGGSAFQSYPSSLSLQTNIHFDDVHVDGLGGQYPFITSKNWTNTGSSFSATGTAIVQKGDAIADSGVRAPIRLNTVQNTYIAGCDIFHTDLTQPCVKLCETLYDDGAVVNMHSCSLEGGSIPISFQKNNSTPAVGAGRSCAMNAVIDDCIVVAGPSTQYLVGTAGSGLTIRNCMFIATTAPKHPSSPRLQAFFSAGAAGTYDADDVGAAPIRAYSCTLICDRAYADNNSATVDVGANSGFTAVSWDNNHVLDMPSMSPVDDDFVPLTTTALWTPRYAGWRDPSDIGVLDDSYKNPATGVRQSKPDTGSSADGGYTTGLVAYDSLGASGTARADPPSIGAWEAD